MHCDYVGECACGWSLDGGIILVAMLKTFLLSEFLLWFSIVVNRVILFQNPLHFFSANLSHHFALFFLRWVA